MCSFLFTLTLWGCKAKIAGDEYIIGPFPVSPQHEQPNRDHHLQGPAPEKEKADQKTKEDKP